MPAQRFLVFPALSSRMNHEVSSGTEQGKQVEDSKHDRKRESHSKNVVRVCARKGTVLAPEQRSMIGVKVLLLHKGSRTLCQGEVARKSGLSAWAAFNRLTTVRECSCLSDSRKVLRFTFA
jgi:hypothetical protein